MIGKDIDNGTTNSSMLWHRFIGNTRVILQMVVKAIEREEKLPTGDIDDWEEWVNDREIVTIDLKRLNEDLFAVLMDKTESEAYFRVKSVEPGNGIEACVKLFKW